MFTITIGVFLCIFMMSKQAKKKHKLLLFRLEGRRRPLTVTLDKVTLITTMLYITPYQSLYTGTVITHSTSITCLHIRVSIK